MTERRQSPRIHIRLECSLHRPTGSPIVASTRDIGPNGMLLTTRRPLTIDEVLRFELALPPTELVDGEARVLRQQGFEDYALRFELLGEGAATHLRDFTAAALA